MAIDYSELKRALSAHKAGKPYSINSKESVTKEENTLAKRMLDARIKKKSRACRTCGRNSLGKLF